MPLRTLAKRCKRFTPLLATPAALLLSQGQAKAVLTYNIFESGGNVVVRASGSLNLPNSFDSFGICLPAGEWKAPNYTCTGSNPVQLVYRLSGSNVLPGTASNTADNVSGIPTVLAPLYAFYGFPVLTIDTGYTGGNIISEAIFNGKTLASDFGITTTGLVGTWTLQPADNSDPYSANDTIQFIVGAPTPPSAAVPGPLPLFGAGAAFAWSRRLRKRIAAPLSTPPQA